MKKTLNGILIVVFLILLVSCDFIHLSKVKVEFDYDKFSQEKSLWNSTKPANYQFKLDYWNDGFSNPVNTLIIVENGVFKTQIPHDDNGFTYESRRNETITDIYENIEDVYNRYHKKRPESFSDYLEKIEIQYDTENHIPVEVKEYFHVPAILADAPSYSEMKITEYKINN